MATEFSPAFKLAFDHSMIYEVGSFWDSSDPAVIAGKIDTAANRKKVGYVNIKQDRGGETKYGIAKNANPDLNIKTLDLADAMEIYMARYWVVGKCDKLTFPLSFIHYDGCVNHGISRAAKILQQAVGASIDGKIGANTLNLANNRNVPNTIREVANIRREFYNNIVRRNPSQKIFLKGWMRRINEIEETTLSLFDDSPVTHSAKR